MSTDKIGDLDRALAEIFNARELSSIRAEPDLPDFDRGALAEMFHDPLPMSASTVQSPSRFDHRALVEIFGEPSSAAIGPSALGSDEEPSPNLVKKPNQGKPAAGVVPVTPPSTSTEGVRPQRAESLLAVMRSIFTTKAEPPAPRPQEGSSPSSPSGQLQTQAEAQAIAVAASADAEHAPSHCIEEPPAHSLQSDERACLVPRASDQPGYVAAACGSSVSGKSRRAAPLSVETAALVSANLQPIPTVLGDEPSSPTAACRPDGGDPSAAVVLAAPGAAASEQQTGLLTTERSPLKLPGSIPPPPVCGTRSREEVSDRLDSAERAADTGPTELESERAASNPTDTLPINPIEMASLLPVQESDTSQEEILIGQPDHAGAAAAVAAVPLATVESTGSQSAPAPLPPNIFADSKSPSPIPGTATLRPGHLDHPGAASPADPQDEGVQLQEPTPSTGDVPTPPVISKTGPAPPSSQPDNVALVAEVAAAILSGETDRAGREQRVPLPAPAQRYQGHLSTPLSGDLVHPAPAAKLAPAAPRIHVAAMQPRQETSLQLTASPSAASSNTSLFPDLDDRSRRALGTRLDAAEPITKASSIRLAIVTAPPRPVNSLQAERHLAASETLKGQASLDARSMRPSRTDRLDEACASQTAVSPAPTTLATVTQPLHVKSLLAKLDLDSAIRLRWVLRDIRANRLGMSPASSNDLATLVALGLVEMREELANLTTLGVRELTEL